MVLMPLRDALVPLLDPTLTSATALSPLRFQLLSVAILLVALLIAMAVPNIEFVFGLTGAPPRVLHLGHLKLWQEPSCASFRRSAERLCETVLSSRSKTTRMFIGHLRTHEPSLGSRLSLVWTLDVVPAPRSEGADGALDLGCAACVSVGGSVAILDAAICVLAITGSVIC